jgi:hypothetical protein
MMIPNGIFGSRDIGIATSWETIQVQEDIIRDTTEGTAHQRMERRRMELRLMVPRLPHLCMATHRNMVLPPDRQVVTQRRWVLREATMLLRDHPVAMGTLKSTCGERHVADRSVRSDRGFGGPPPGPPPVQYDSRPSYGTGYVPSSRS